MAGINKVTLIGNLGAKPELRTASNGNMWTSLSVATSEAWMDKASGEKREKTEWHKVVIWGKLAEVASKYTDKGSKIYLEGKLETRSWTDQNSGEKRYTTEVVLSGFNAAFQILDKRDDFASNSEKITNTATPVSGVTEIKMPAPIQPERGIDAEPFSDDIPF